MIADSLSNREAMAALVPPTKSPFRLHNRSVLLFFLTSSKVTNGRNKQNHSFFSFFFFFQRSYSSASLATAGHSHDPDQSLTNYIHHLEKVQQRLVGPWQGETRRGWLSSSTQGTRLPAAGGFASTLEMRGVCGEYGVVTRGDVEPRV